jgi:Clp amino terminal domain, pathogenicity island component
MPRSAHVEALVVRVVGGADPVRRLAALSELRRELDALESELAAQAIGAGMSWREVGDAIGVSKQAAHRRHRDGVANVRRGRGDSELTAGNIKVSIPARRAVQLARREAVRLGGEEVDTEHLLLGILQCGDGQAVPLLHGLGVTVETARDAVQPATEETLEAARRAYSNSDPAIASRLVSPVARRILERVLTQAAGRGSSELSALDLLRGVVTLDGSGAARTLSRLGVRPARIRAEIVARNSQRLDARG